MEKILLQSKSLLAGRSLLKKGLRWIIGNGKQVKIWKDKWIQRPTSYCIQSPISLLDENARIVELIDINNHYWKSDLINQIFNPEEVRAIYAIPLSFINRDDKLAWYPTKTGLFSVKNAYHLHHSLILSSRGDTSSSLIPKQT